MPLSDREQQILQEIENQLYEHEPEFARGVTTTTLQVHLQRNIRRGILPVLVGIATLILFFFRPLLPIGVVAFLVMLVAAIYTYDNLRKMGSEQLRILREQATVSNMVARIRNRIREMGQRGNPGA
jgi:hypothetical protein